MNFQIIIRLENQLHTKLEIGLDVGDINLVPVDLGHKK